MAKKDIKKLFDKIPMKEVFIDGEKKYKIKLKLVQYLPMDFVHDTKIDAREIIKQMFVDALEREFKKMG